MDSKELQKKMDVMWKKMKKDLDGVWKETSVLVTKGEKFFKSSTKKGQQELEVISLSMQREKLYYELGKVVSIVPQRPSTTKKKQALIKKIKAIAEKIKKLKRAIKK